MFEEKTWSRIISADFVLYKMRQTTCDKAQRTMTFRRVLVNDHIFVFAVKTYTRFSFENYFSTLMWHHEVWPAVPVNKRERGNLAFARELGANYGERWRRSVVDYTLLLVDSVGF